MSSKENILIKACLKGDRKAQQELFQLFVPYVHVVVRRYLYDNDAVKDNVQEVFIKVFNSFKTSFDINKGELKPWIRKIAINQCIYYNKKNRSFDDIEDYREQLHVDPSVFENFKEEELMSFLAEMPSVLKVVFNMFIIDGYSHDEIASVLQITSAASRKKVSRARAWVQEKITVNQFSN